MEEIEILIGCLLPAAYSAYTDFIKRYLYDYITIPVFILGVAYSIYIGTILNTAITALVVFTILLIAALCNGITGGDVKFTTALAIWFGCPGILFVLAAGCLLALPYGIIHLKRMGILEDRANKFYREIKFRLLYHRKSEPINHLPDMGMDGEDCPEALPFGTFWTLGAWIVFIMMHSGFVWCNLL